MTPYLKNGVIMVSQKYVRSLGIKAIEDQEFLNSQIESRCICPPIFMIKDSERARILLKVSAEPEQQTLDPAAEILIAGTEYLKGEKKS